MAIDKAAIVEAVYQGAGKVAKNPIPPTLWSYNDAIRDYRFDRRRPSGCSAKLAIQRVSRPSSGTCR